MHETFKRLVEASGGLTPAELARVLNESPQTINNWSKRGVSRAGALNAEKIFKCSSLWVLTGVDNRNFEIHPISTWDSSTPLDADEVEIVFYKDLKFACGSGYENEVLGQEHRRLRISRVTLERLGINKNDSFAATAHDDSMNPNIQDGDTVWVDRGRKSIKDGKIYAVDHGGLFKCKRLYQLPNGGVRIVSDNHAEFEEIRLSAEQIEAENFNVIGWVWKIDHLEKW